MDLQKLIWKIPITTANVAKPDTFFKVFNTWLPNSPEIFVDVADYQHVHDGPLTVLIGHYVDYILDKTNEELSLCYRSKRGLKGKSSEQIQTSLNEALKGFKRLEKDKAFNGQLKFNSNQLQFIVNDRAIAAQANGNKDKILKDLKSVCDKTFGKNKYTISSDAIDKRTRLTFTITIQSPSGDI